MSIRLNKLLAQRGVAARRKCDELIEQGRVRVNGQIVRELGTTVDPDHDRIEVGGRLVPRAAERRYFVLNKPVGIITTLDDPEGRPTIREFLPPGPRLFPVGRLDSDTSGLLVLTDDGDLAHKLMHPRYGVEKVYRVWLEREPSEAQLERLRHGVEFEPGLTSAPARVRKLTVDRRGLVEISIHEGRYRQVRRMFEAVGLAVTGLHRSAYGPLRLGPLPRGMWRELSDVEVARLRAASARAVPRSGPARRGSYFSARRGIVPPSPRGEGEHGVPERAGRPRDARGGGRRERNEQRPERRAGTLRRERPEAAGRFERPGSGERSERPGRGARTGRPARGERFERTGPGARTERPLRAERFERPARSARPDRGEPFVPFDRFAPERSERPGGARPDRPRRGFAPRERTERGFDRGPSGRPGPRPREGRPVAGGRSGRGERGRPAPVRGRFDRSAEPRRGREFGDRDRSESPRPRRYGDRPVRTGERERPRSFDRNRAGRPDRNDRNDRNGRSERGGPRPANRFQRGGSPPSGRTRQPFARPRADYGPPGSAGPRRPAGGPNRSSRGGPAGPSRGGRGMGDMARGSARTRRPGPFRRPRRPSEGE